MISRVEGRLQSSHPLKSGEWKVVTAGVNPSVLSPFVLPAELAGGWSRWTGVEPQGR
jgi:hypothetical protein